MKQQLSVVKGLVRYFTKFTERKADRPAPRPGSGGSCAPKKAANDEGLYNLNAPLSQAKIRF